MLMKTKRYYRNNFLNIILIFQMQFYAKHKPNKFKYILNSSHHFSISNKLQFKNDHTFFNVLHIRYKY